MRQPRSRFSALPIMPMTTHTTVQNGISTFMVGCEKIEVRKIAYDRTQPVQRFFSENSHGQ